MDARYPRQDCISRCVRRFSVWPDVERAGRMAKLFHKSRPAVAEHCHWPASKTRASRPLKSLDFLIYKSRYSAEIIGPAVLVLLSIMFVYSGALFPASLPKYFSSENQLLGQVLLLILTPAFLVTYLIVASLASLAQTDDWLVALANDIAIPLPLIVGFRGIRLGELDDLEWLCFPE